MENPVDRHCCVVAARQGDVNPRVGEKSEEGRRGKRGVENYDIGLPSVHFIPRVTPKVTLKRYHLH